MPKRILVITDCVDIAANELRAVLVTELDRLGADDVVVEPIVKTEEFSLLNASFASRLLAESYNPADLTILGVVNPLNSSEPHRARIAGRLKNGIQFVCANTGIFSWLFEEFGIEEICEVNNHGLKGEDFISFGGKFIHAPIAAQLAFSGDINASKIKDFDQKDLVTIDHPEGIVLHIDNFGVPKIYYKFDDLAKLNSQTVEILSDGKSLGQATIATSMKELPDNTLAVYKSSSLGLTEIGIVRQLNTAQSLGIKTGQLISFRAV